MSNFKATIQQFNKQLSFKSLKFNNLNNLKYSKPDAVIFVGMGGSGQIGDIVIGLKKELDIPVPILCWKNYNLPHTSYKKPLYLFISYSGNTEETLSGFNKAQNKAVITSGGKLLTIAQKQNIPLATFINPGIKPRQGSGFMYYGVLGVLRSVFPKLKIISFAIDNLESIGKSIAKKINNKTVLIYSSQKNKYLAYNWKTRLNETAKIPAFIGVVPEICHNEIEIFENPNVIKNTLVLFIKDQNDNIQTKKQFLKLEKLLKISGVKSQSIELKENSPKKAWNSIILADWVSYYLAQAKGINPANTALIDKLKLIK